MVLSIVWTTGEWQSEVHVYHGRGFGGSALTPSICTVSRSARWNFFIAFNNSWAWLLMIEKKTNVECIMFRLLLWVMFILGHGHTFYCNYKLMPFITPGTFILHHGLVRYYKCYNILRWKYPRYCQSHKTVNAREWLVVTNQSKYQHKRASPGGGTHPSLAYMGTLHMPLNRIWFSGSRVLNIVYTNYFTI